jgi:ankyrin repeat domain-containing protein 50
MLNTTYLVSLNDCPGNADVARGTEWGKTLCAAAYFGHEDIVKKLLQDETVVTTKRKCGFALVYASQVRNGEIVRMLLDHGTNVNSRGRTHGSALQAAAYGGHHNVVQLLLA